MKETEIKAIKQKTEQVMEAMCADGYVAGVNCMVLERGKELFYTEKGYRDLAAKKPMTRDTIFKLYSMTKPVTSAAVMMLIEEGRIDLLDQAAYFLPGFKDPWLMEDGRSVKAYRGVTVQDLLNMTSGVAYPGDGNPSEVYAARLIDEVKEKMRTEEALCTVEIANRAGKNPLSFQPGATWRYGFSADVLGAIVEVVSGMRYGDFLEERIFKPLGMKDTAFYVPAEKQDRLAVAYGADESGLIPYTGENLGIMTNMEQRPAFESGGAGLASTIDDYSRFASMLMNGGSLEGVRLLSERTVDFMTKGHLNAAQQKGVETWEGLAGYSYANLMRIMKDPEMAVSISELGEYGWDGWLGTYFCNAPESGITILLMYQRQDAGTTGYTRRIRNIIFSRV